MWEGLGSTSSTTTEEEEGEEGEEEEEAEELVEVAEDDALGDAPMEDEGVEIAEEDGLVEVEAIGDEAVAAAAAEAGSGAFVGATAWIAFSRFLMCFCSAGWPSARCSDDVSSAIIVDATATAPIPSTTPSRRALPPKRRFFDDDGEEPAGVAGDGEAEEAPFVGGGV